MYPLYACRLAGRLLHRPTTFSAPSADLDSVHEGVRYTFLEGRNLIHRFPDPVVKSFNPTFLAELRVSIPFPKCGGQGRYSKLHQSL